jgi:hypothetical protein
MPESHHLLGVLSGGPTEELTVRQEKEEEMIGSFASVVFEVNMRLPIIHYHGVVS